MRFYGVRLRDLFVGPPEDPRLTMSELLDYVRGLPMDGAVGREVAGTSADWETTDYLLANVVDLLAAANWQRSGRKSGKPKPIKRPRPPTSRG